MTDEPARPEVARASPVLSKGIMAALALAFLLLGLRTIGASSPTTDEPGHYRYGHRILRGVAER